MMKRIFLFGLMMLPFVLRAQKKNLLEERLFLVNGEVKEGKISGITSEVVFFIPSGSSNSVSIPKSQLSRIEFQELPEKKDVQEKTDVPLSKNRVAILPLSYIGNGMLGEIKEMPYLLQEEAYKQMKKSAKTLDILDPAEVNALLGQKGIKPENLKDFTITQLAGILKSEYIITGSVYQSRGNSSTYTNTQESGKRALGGNHGRVESKDQRSVLSYSNTQENISTTVDLKIYNEQGKSIHLASRNSMLSTLEAYRNTLSYLVKRTPLSGK